MLSRHTYTCSIHVDICKLVDGRWSLVNYKFNADGSSFGAHCSLLHGARWALITKCQHKTPNAISNMLQ